MSYTRQQYCQDSLSLLNAKDNSGFNVFWLAAWSCFETVAPNSASFNIFNTTLKATDSTNYNSVGVQNYSSLQEGESHFVQTLENGYYSAIINAIKNDFNSSAYLNSNIGQNLSLWGTGNKSQAIYSLAQSMQNGLDSRYSDIFSTNVEVQTRENQTLSFIPVNSASDLLYNIDQSMIVVNPFSVNAPSVSIFGQNIPDPLAWIGLVGTNTLGDITAFTIRFIIILIGVILLWKSLGTLVKWRKS